MMKIAILSAHTDDGELGCGGTISRLINDGDEVHHICFSDAKESNPNFNTREEFVNANRILGVHKIFTFDYKVREFTFSRQEILQRMVTVNQDEKYNLIFTHTSFDHHQDHRVIYEESVRAFKCNLLGYELPWNCMDFRIGQFYWISEDDLSRKQTALLEYRSQAERHYFANEFPRCLATVRGAQCRVKYAEAFEVIRLIK